MKIFSKIFFAIFFFLFLLETWIVGARWSRLAEAVLTGTHGLCFGAEIKRIGMPLRTNRYAPAHTGFAI